MCQSQGPRGMGKDLRLRNGMSMWWGFEVLEEVLEPSDPFRRGPVTLVRR